jgi:hypothetical protein
MNKPKRKKLNRATGSLSWDEWNGSHYLSDAGYKTGYWLLRNDDATLWYVIGDDGYSKDLLPLKTAKEKAEVLYLANAKEAN